MSPNAIINRYWMSWQLQCLKAKKAVPLTECCLTQDFFLISVPPLRFCLLMESPNFLQKKILEVAIWLIDGGQQTHSETVCISNMLCFYSSCVVIRIGLGRREVTPHLPSSPLVSQNLEPEWRIPHVKTLENKTHGVRKMIVVPTQSPGTLFEASFRLDRLFKTLEPPVPQGGDDLHGNPPQEASLINSVELSYVQTWNI